MFTCSLSQIEYHKLHLNDIYYNLYIHAYVCISRYVLSLYHCSLEVPPKMTSLLVLEEVIMEWKSNYSQKLLCSDFIQLKKFGLECSLVLLVSTYCLSSVSFIQQT